MKNLIFFLFAIGACVLMVSCYKEDAIIPTSSEGGERFVFPQGNADHDQKIKNVYDNFGVKIIYKGFKNTDFGLSWTNVSTGRVGSAIPDAQQENATGFMVEHIFGNLTPEVTKMVLPPYFYVADSVADVSVIPNYSESLNAVANIFNGLDFWSFTWDGAAGYTKMLATGAVTKRAAAVRPSNPFSVFYKRGIILKEVLKMAINKGNIKSPDDFSVGFDFVTATTNLAGSENEPNYYMKRGFPGQMTNSNNFNITNLVLVTRTSEKQNFIDYVHLCMRYTPDSIELVYPKAKYPLIHQKYPIVIKHMKDNYNIDLNKIATKPQI